MNRKNTGKGMNVNTGTNARGNTKVRAGKRSSVRYELKASYENNKRIYTVLDVSANRTLDDVCSMILDAFDFTHEHLYLFNFDGRGYGSGENVYLFMPDPSEKGTDIRLGDLNLSVKQKFYLLYDFGDDWGFDIQVQKIYEAEGHVIDGIVSVKGQLEQYPDPDDFDDEFDDEFEEWFEDYLDDMEAEEEAIPFRICPSLKICDVLDTINEDEWCHFASVFLGKEKTDDFRNGKNIQALHRQYAQAVLQDKERFLMFMRGKAVDIFEFMMTAGIDPESGALGWTDLMEQVIFEDERDMEEVSVSLMHLYSLGICMPELDSKGMVQSFSICQEVRDVYEKWMKQTQTRSKIIMYEEMEELAVSLSYRYGVVDVGSLQKICQDELGYRMKKEDFRWMLEGRLVCFNRFELHDGLAKDTVFLSAFGLEDTKKVLSAREKYSELTYYPYDITAADNLISENPFGSVGCFMELAETLLKSIQDVHTAAKLIRDITDMCMLETEPDMIIKEARSVLNMCGKRMTKKLQELIREVAGNMPLSTRYGYTLAELDRMK